MDILQQTIAVYERMRKKAYRITIDNGEEILLRFLPSNYHHLAGFQHLADLGSLSNPKSKDLFYGEIRRGKVQCEKVQRSACFHEISERLTSFGVLEEILAEGDAKIIVEYDKSKLSSEIEAKYYLYRRVGDQFAGNVKYHILFLGCRDMGYYPSTYIVEHSNIYIRDQELHFCKIEHCELQ